MKAVNRGVETFWEECEKTNRKKEERKNNTRGKENEEFLTKLFQKQFRSNNRDFTFQVGTHLWTVDSEGKPHFVAELDCVVSKNGQPKFLLEFKKMGNQQSFGHGKIQVQKAMALLVDPNTSTYLGGKPNSKSVPVHGGHDLKGWVVSTKYVHQPFDALPKDHLLLQMLGVAVVEELGLPNNSFFDNLLKACKTPELSGVHSMTVDGCPLQVLDCSA